MSKKKFLGAREIRALQMFDGRKEIPDTMMAETLRALAAKGLVTKRVAMIGYRSYYAITDAGRAALQEKEAGE